MLMNVEGIRVNATKFNQRKRFKLLFSAPRRIMNVLGSDIMFHPRERNYFDDLDKVWERRRRSVFIPS